MKKVIASIALCTAFASANAAASASATLDIWNPSSSTSTTSGFNPVPGVPSALTFLFGSLYATGAGTVTYTYLGSEAGDSNRFNGVSSFFTKSSTVGVSSFSDSVSAAGYLNFSFQTTDPRKDRVTVSNTVGNVKDASFGITSGYSQGGKSYDYALLFNDCGGNGCKNGGDTDFDDFVVGVQFTAVSPVPEPETYAMLLAGLALIGSVAKRRKSN